MYSTYLLSIKYLDEARKCTRENEAAMFHFLIAPQQEYISEIKATANDFDKAYSEYLKQPAQSYEKERWPRIETELAVYRTERQKAIDIANQGDKNGAYDYFNKNATPHLDFINAMLQELTNFNTDQADKTNAQNNADYALSVKILITLSIATVLLGLLLGFGVARLISNSIKKVLEGVERVAAGDLTMEDVIIKENDEVGQLTTSFNTMKKNLYGLVSQVAQSSEQVASSSEELTAIAEQNTQASTHIATSIERVAQGTETQTTAIDETSTAIEQISAAIQQVAASSSEVAEQAGKTSLAAEEGQKAIDQAVGQMDKIVQVTGETQNAIDQLAMGSNKIAEITDVISGIAAQTNLLALNAAIEAARAGEQGRGFAVVAEEVRKLAEQSSDAAKQIADLINENQTNIDHAVRAMQAGGQDVQTGIEVVSAAGETFVQIATSINQVVSQIQEVAATVEEMASGSQQIVSSIKQVENISKETLDQSQTVSAATEEQTASIEQIASASQSLAEMAQELQAAVNKFKV